MTWAREPFPLPFLYTHEIQATTATSQFPTSDVLGILKYGFGVSEIIKDIASYSSSLKTLKIYRHA
jgi:hypothetical protein